MRGRDRLHDREAEAEGAAAVARAAHEALEQRVAQLGRDARPVVLDDELDLPPAGAPCETRISVPGGVWRSAFSIRLIATRWSSSRAAVHGRGLRVERDLVVVR